MSEIIHVGQSFSFSFEHLYSPRMVGEIKERKKKQLERQTNKQTVIHLWSLVLTHRRLRLDWTFCIIYSSLFTENGRNLRIIQLYQNKQHA